MLRAAKKSLVEVAILGGLTTLILVALIGVTSILGWFGYVVVLVPFFAIVGGR